MKTNNQLEDVSGFWDGEECEYCNGRIIERRVELYRHKKRKRILFENVPAGVCISCGARYYSANVLKMLDRMSRNSSDKPTLAIPLVHFA